MPEFIDELNVDIYVNSGGKLEVFISEFGAVILKPIEKDTMINMMHGASHLWDEAKNRGIKDIILCSIVINNDVDLECFQHLKSLEGLNIQLYNASINPLFISKQMYCVG